MNKRFFVIILRRPDGVGTVTQEEKEAFTQIKERLRILLEHQLTNFRFCFPFGRPEGALKATISLLERVNQGSISSTYLRAAFTPVASQSVRTQTSCQYLFTLMGYMCLKAVNIEH